MKNIDRLKEYGQEHLLRFFDELNEEEKKSLIDQINEADFELLDALKNKDQNKATDDQGGALAPLGALEIDEIKKNKDKYE